jgi:glycosyltransferase involved in cell wall biosynthesis
VNMTQTPTRKPADFEPVTSTSAVASMQPRKRHRVAVFVPTLAFGGVERVMLNLAQGFCERGFEVDIVTPLVEGEFRAYIPKKARLVDLRAGRVLTSLPMLIRYLRHDRPVAVLTAMEHSSVIAIWARAIARVATVIIATVHTNLSEVVKHAPSRKVRLVPFACRCFLHRADAVVAVSQGVADDLVEHAPKCRARLHVIYNPIITSTVLCKAKQALDHWWFGPEQPPVILGAGRLAQQKDFETLIRAFALVRQQRPARLLILGEGAERQRLEALAADLGIRQDVSLPGYEENPYRYMSRAALFVLSSAWEGFGNVLVEALAAGTPVLATDCKNGPREILEAVRQGRLVPVGDADAMAREMLVSLDERPEPASAAALRVFTMDYVVDEYAALLQAILMRKDTGRSVVL